MDDLSPDEDTAAWVTEVLGDSKIESHFAHEHGNSNLWRIRTGSKRVWLKMHASSERWAAETNALAQWGPKTGLMPIAIRYRSEPAAILMTEIPAVPAKSLGREGVRVEKLWREAGTWLARLHAIEEGWFGSTTGIGAPLSKPETDPQAFAQGHWSKALSAAKVSGLFDESELRYASAAAQEGLEKLEGERPRATHRDFTPRNWLATPDGHLAGVIDFEHARFDARAADLCLLYHRDFIVSPHLEGAFLDGYGGLDEALRSQLKAFRAMLAIQRAIWAAGVGATQFAKENTEALGRLAEAYGKTYAFPAWNDEAGLKT